MHWRDSKKIPLVAGLVLLSACSQPASDSQLKVEAPKLISTAEIKKYELRGEVKELDTQAKIAKIQHEAIGDWMGAMTMEFPVKEPADFAKLHVGDKITAAVFVQDIRFWIGEVRPTPTSTTK